MINTINSLLLGNTKLSGLRTILLNSIALIIAVWEFASKDGGLFTMLCDSFTVMCNVSETQFYTVAIAIVLALNNVLRWLTVTPVGVEASPAQLEISKEEPDAKQNFATIIAYASLGVIAAIVIIVAV